VTVSRRETAVQLRLAGLSRSQIAEALGLAGGDEPLSTWLKDVPAPAWTRRPRARDDLREIAVAMREEGRSYREIRDVVGVSKSTLSLWLRDVPLSEEQQRALDLRAPANVSSRAQARRASAAQRRVRIHNEARAQVARSQHPDCRMVRRVGNRSQ
jgi:transcriptional regulator with XRE-family HTH domain